MFSPHSQIDSFFSFDNYCYRHIHILFIHNNTHVWLQDWLFCIGQPVRASILGESNCPSPSNNLLAEVLWGWDLWSFLLSTLVGLLTLIVLVLLMQPFLGGDSYSADFFVLWLLNSFCLFFQEVLGGPVIEDTAYIGNRTQKNQAGSGLKASFLLYSFQFLKALCKLLREGSNE